MVYIVILNWNGWKDTLDCLDSIYQLKNTDFKVVVCDNGSHDDSIYHIEGWYKNLRLANSRLSDICFLDQEKITQEGKSREEDFIIIRSHKNLGYAGGNNLALRFCLSQMHMSHVWILNNDTEVSSDSLNKQQKISSRNSDQAIIGSKLVYYSQRDILQGIGGCYNYWLGQSSHVLGNCPVDGSDEKSSVDYPIGASIFIPRKCLEKVGLLSEDYFLYYEELDYVNRAKGFGFIVDIALDSIIYHKEGASIKKSVVSDFYFIRNKFIISYKYKPFSLIVIFFLLPFWSLNRIRRKEFRKAMNCFKAFGSFIKWLVLKK